MDGLSGIKIYNAVNVDTRFLPKNYPDNLQFIIKGVNHKLSDSDWETNFETVVISRNEYETDKTYPFLKTTIDEILKDKINPVASWTSTIIDPLTKGIRSSNKTLREILTNAGYTPGTFNYELAKLIGTKEGYKPNSTNNPSRNNNPGNLTGTNFKDIDPGVTQSGRFAKFSTPELGAKALVERKIKPWSKGNYPGTIVNGSKNVNDVYRKKYNIPNSLAGIAGKKVNLTIEQFFYIYAPPSDGNNTEKYIADIVILLKSKFPNINRLSKLIDYINK
jgi:hypothetical protein